MYVYRCVCTTIQGFDFIPETSFPCVSDNNISFAASLRVSKNNRYCWYIIIYLYNVIHTQACALGRHFSPANRLNNKRRVRR